MKEGSVMDASAKLLAIVAIAAFITERTLAAASYVMDTIRYIRVHRSAVKMRAKAKRRLVLVLLAAVIAYLVVDRADLRMLRLIAAGQVQPVVDFWLTWLVVFAGADRVRSMLNGEVSGGAASKEAPTPLLQVRVNGGEIQDLRRIA
jgi:hypothetical protein